MDDLRWFAPNRYCTLPVPALRRAGLRIALEGDEPAGLAIAADGQKAVDGFEYARRHRCPLLLYVWDLPPWRLGSGRPDFVFELGGVIRRLPRPLNGYPERSGYYSRIGFVARRALEVWTPSTNTLADVRVRFGVAAERVPFCYDSERYRPMGRRHSAPDSPVLLTVARLVPHKNQAAVIRAAALLTPRPAVRIVGQGPEAEPLRRLARTLGVPLQLADTWATDEEVVAAYQSASVVVCPSRFEGFGLTPMQGIAMGVPVIASDIPAHREFVNGPARLFPLDEDGALAGAIADGLSHPAGGDAASLRELTIEACAARFFPRIERLLGRVV